MRCACSVIVTGILAAGCRPTEPIEITRTKGSKEHVISDIHVKIGGSWVKFYEHTRDTRLVQDPRGKYIVVTDYAATKMSRISVFSVRDRKLTDITRQLYERLGNLSQYPWFYARRFVGGSMVEFGICAYKCSAEEKPVIKTLERTRFHADILELIEAANKQKGK